MTTSVDQPLFTKTWEDEDAFRPEDGAVYIFASALEERGEIEAEWRSARPLVRFIEVVQQEPFSITLETNGVRHELPTRASRRLSTFFQSLPAGAPVYLDITSMGHSTWAPLVKACARESRALRVVYSEPIEYARSRTPTEGDIFDLSSRIEGISPLPGFARLATGGRGADCFVPLLGFEGTRFAYLREHVQPVGERIVPVIGVPGFRPEFPFFAYLGNRPPMVETKAWRRVRYTKANCPFSLYYLLETISTSHADCFLKIAPIGTKPHALGAVLFAMNHADRSELVYDHPVRKAGRSTGHARLLVYFVSEFLA